jgi:radical SAM superfamily enzyme YgiQ (UPF0313 family)
MSHVKKLVFCYFAPWYSYYTPLDIGIIFAKLKRYGAKYNLHAIRLGFHNQNYYEKIMQLKPDAVFFMLDNIIWSGTYAFGASMRAAVKLKKEEPGIFIGFQSHKIRDEDADDALKLIDCVVGTNPEDSFMHIDELLDGRPVAGTATKHGKIKENPPEALEGLPSPYLDGIFDKHLMRYKKTMRPFISTSRGCIYGCFYCHRSVKFEKLRYFPVSRAYDEIEYIMRIGYRNFFIIDDCFLTTIERLREFKIEFESRKLINSKIGDINLMGMCRPDVINEEVVILLRNLNFRSIQIGIQTINPKLQGFMKREMDLSKLDKISRLFTENGIEMMIDLIIGLPGDDIEHFRKSLDKAISMEPKLLQVKQLYLNPNTKFDKDRQEFGIVPGTNRSFGPPFVIKAAGISEDYFDEAYSYLKKKMDERKDIRWKWITQYSTYHEQYSRNSG